jgi:hypothetical protein
VDEVREFLSTLVVKAMGPRIARRQLGMLAAEFLTDTPQEKVQQHSGPSDRVIHVAAPITVIAA